MIQMPLSIHISGGSPLHVRQIFINILSNSIKYNKKGGKIFNQISVSRISEKQVIYRAVIKDTGIGMSEEFLQRLFDPFSREHEGINSFYEGTGLGMSIVKKLVEKMEGTIEVQSEVGKGSTFTITLPFETAQESDIQKDDADLGQCDLSGVHVLLVEDNELNMEIAEILLGDEGLEVVEAKNGKEALERFAASAPGQFSYIFMDVMMPTMDGLEATRQIRALERADAKSIPIIAMTANAFTEDKEACLNAGMNAHLAKPIRREELRKAIQEYS